MTKLIELPDKLFQFSIAVQEAISKENYQQFNPKRLRQCGIRMSSDTFKYLFDKPAVNPPYGHICGLAVFIDDRVKSKLDDGKCFEFLYTVEHSYIKDEPQPEHVGVDYGADGYATRADFTYATMDDDVKQAWDKIAEEVFDRMGDSSGSLLDNYFREMFLNGKWDK